MAKAYIFGVSKLSLKTVILSALVVIHGSGCALAGRSGFSGSANSPETSKFESSSSSILLSNSGLVMFADDEEAPSSLIPVGINGIKSDFSTRAPSPLPSPVLELTPEVKRALGRFAVTERSYIESALPTYERYHPHISRIFDQMGVPQELVNLAIVESRFQPDAVSHKGAVGLWQFMSATARSFGLRVPPARRLAYLDERRDPILSTFAAARFLRHLYEEFGCWHLALAAYNSGLGNVNRAIGRAKKYDFWSLARRGLLAKETADFVPRFIAVTLIMSNPKRYGFNALS